MIIKKQRKFETKKVHKPVNTLPMQIGAVDRYRKKPKITLAKINLKDLTDNR